MHPPNSANSEDKLGFKKSVLVTNTVEEGTRSIQLYEDEVGVEVRSLEETLTVVQGCLHFEGFTPLTTLIR